MICSSSHIIFTDKPKFVIVPTLEYDRFNFYKLLFYKLWEVPHFRNRSVE
ncbi:hypothetical protein LEP1GSC081_4063 [Leptospira kirschneri str. H1]|uniref:Uncharacterized protein n=1 Tax=Leptospira kirschneri str. H1 TaxID=1049966 RepID=A0A0E2B626_9LEPT|nr:hypothetical protein LEP1GSC081_4063 [Leptospira kirschneri str. H1]